MEREKEVVGQKGGVHRVYRVWQVPGAPACCDLLRQSAPASQHGATPLGGKGKHLPPRAAHLVWASPGLGTYEGLHTPLEPARPALDEQ